MTKEPSIIRKKEARPVHNPQRIAALVATFAALVAVVLGGSIMFRGVEVQSPSQVVKIEVPAEVVDVVVASTTVAYNEKLKRADLKVVKWPKDSKPVGSFSSIDDVFSDDADRYFMARTIANEVILPGKLSEPGRQATLAALLHKNTRAVSVRVDDVLGVSGFVRPGDFVDVIMTRSTDDSVNPVNFSVTLLQNIHVLGVDQTSRVTSDVADVVKRAAKTVTLEVDIVAAQKLALGGTVGKLSLALRQPKSTVYRQIKQIRMADLAGTGREVTRGGLQLTSGTASKPAALPPKKLTKTIGVTRAVERVEVEVAPDDATEIKKK